MELNHTIVTCLFNPAFDFWRWINFLKKSLSSSGAEASRIVTIPANLALFSFIQALHPSKAVGKDSLETHCFHTGGKYLSRFPLVSERSPLSKGFLVYC